MEFLLHRLIETGRIDRVKKILMEHPEVDVNELEEERGCGLLHTACRRQDCPGLDTIITMLLAHPDIRVNERNSTGETPFMVACGNGTSRCLRLLLKDSRVDISLRGDNGYTPLQLAALISMIDTFEWWIASGRELDVVEATIFAEKAFDRPALYEDRFPWNIHGVMHLLERFRENPEMTRREIRSELGVVDEIVVDTPPPRLTRAEYEVFLGSLPQHPSSLLFAVKEGEIDEVREISRRNPDFDASEALHTACRHLHASMVAVLLAHHTIDVNWKGSDDGCTPFMAACVSRNTDIVRVLLKDPRVNPNEHNINGESPLRNVAFKGYVDILKWWAVSGKKMDMGIPGQRATDVRLA